MLVCAGLAVAEPIRVGDDALQITLSDDQGVWREAAFASGGVAIPDLSGELWLLTIDGQAHRPGLARIAASQPAGGLALEGADEGFDWRLAYVVSGAGRVTKTLSVTARRPVLIERITLWDAASPLQPVVPRTSLQDIAAIYRTPAHGLFASLDYPYSRITVAQGRTRVSYPPHIQLAEGEAYACHSLTIGAVRRRPPTAYGFDRGEIDALDRYVQERFTPRFDRPMIVSCSINNRYTQPRGDVIFATMKDHPTLRDNTELLERELALMPKLGVEYYQVFPGVFDWGPNDPSAAQVDRLMGVARGHGVRMGDYSGATSVFCAHYNEYRNRLDKPQWLIRNAEGQVAGGYCFGNPAFVDYYVGTVVPNCKRFGFEIHCLDFLGLKTCHAADHGHPPGEDGLYHQVRGLLELLAGLDSVSPQMMSWSNSGNWAELLPKIAWHNPNLYLTDPFISTPWQGLNMTRLLDDARREQMVSLHNTRFIPYRFLTNCQYFFSQNSIVPDLRHYQFGALSTLAVTPNLCLGEVRPWLDRLAQPDREQAIEFYRTWTAFVRRHFDLWTTTYELGEPPGPGAVEVYAHAQGSRGFVFIVNPQYWSRQVEVPLDARAGLTARGPVEIEELYPTRRLRLWEQGPFPKLGDTLHIEAPAQQVVVLEIRPAAAQTGEARVFGLPGTIEPTPSGLLWKTSGPQGTSARALVIPAEPGSLASAEVSKDEPRIPKRLWSPIPLSFWPAEGGGLLVDLTFRGQPAPNELREWRVLAGTPSQGLTAKWHTGLPSGKLLRFPLFAGHPDQQVSMPMSEAQAQRLKLGPLASFCGGYVENAFSEEQETLVELATRQAPAPAQTQPASALRGGPSGPMPAEALDPQTSWWLETSFALPFMYTMGAEPAFDEHTVLVLPTIRQGQIASLQAWVNGSPLEVRLYRYPRNRGLGCYWADLVGTAAAGGDNRLVVHLQAAHGAGVP